MKIHSSPWNALVVRIMAFAVLFGSAAHAQAQQNSVEDEVTLILNAMSDEQKQLYCIGYGVDFSFTNIKGVFNIRPVDDLELEDGRVIDLPLIYGCDGGVGFVGQGFDPGVRFPAGPLLASTWNPDRAYSLGDALGREGSARGIHRMLAPGSNFYRTPYNGRSFEYVTGEDPLLGATLLPAVVRGMQEHRVMATCKHPVANDQEINRNSIVVEVDERTLREIYLPPFEAAVKLGDTAALMGSYNKLKGDYATDQVNGDWACESYFLLTQVFKQDWGFPGFVESDYLAIHDGVKAAQAGIDIDMPGGYGSPFGVPDQTVMTPEDLQQSGADIDDKVRRMLRRIVAYDFIENPPQENDAAIIAAAQNSKEVAIQTAREGIVLLENRNPRPWNRHFTKMKSNFRPFNRHSFKWDRDLLPLNRQSVKKIAVIGPNAEGEPLTGSGSATVPPSDDFISEIDGIKSLAPGATVDFIAQAIAIHLARNYAVLVKESHSGSTSLPPYKLRQITDWMAEHMAEDFDLARLAAQAGLSKFHFDRQFKSAMDVSPSRYLTNLRMEAARRLLRETRKSVLTVTLDVGYSSPSYFAQLFRRETGLSPSEYRRQR